MAKTKPAYITRKLTVADAVSEAYSILEELAGEMREAFDNTPESLQQSAVGEAREAAADALEGLSEPNVLDELGRLEFEYTEPPPKRKQSRRDRRDQATALLSAVIAVVDNVDDENADPAVELRDELDDLMSEADSVEFPGMYG